MAKTETSGARCAMCGKRMTDRAADGASDRAAAAAGASGRAAAAGAAPPDGSATLAGATAPQGSAAPDHATAPTGAAAAEGATAPSSGCCKSCWVAAVASSSESVRTAAARRPGAPGWALTALAADPSPLVRAEVALRTDLTDEVVEALADPERERDRTVLRRMARHPAVGRHASALAELNDVVVRRQLAGNPSTPTGVLTGLARHTDPTVSRVAKARLIAAALDASERERLPVGLRAFLAARSPGRR